MKKNLNIKITLSPGIKALAAAFFLALLPIMAHAQYTGGEGDGYDMAQFIISANAIAPNPVQEWEAAVYPNPVHNTTSITISFKSDKVKRLRLLDLSGHEVLRMAVAAGQEQAKLALPELNPGFYQILLEGEEAACRLPLFVN